MNDYIHASLVDAVLNALQKACVTQGINPSGHIAMRQWAMNIVEVELKAGRLPTEETIGTLVASLPPLFVSDSNR